MKKIKRIVFGLMLTLLFVNSGSLYLLAEELTPTATPTETIEPTPSPEQLSTETITPTESMTPSPSETESSPTPSVITVVENVDGSSANTGDNTSSNNEATSNEIQSGEADSGVDQTTVANGEVVANNEVDSGANSGGNVADNNDSKLTIITTSDAVAFANLVNLLNTKLIDSEVKITVIDLGSSQGDLNLSNNDEGVSVSGTSEGSGQLSALNNDVEVAANTGSNEATDNAGTVIIETGNAIALANILNLINTTLISSKYQISIINITDSFSGNIILPRPDAVATSQRLSQVSSQSQNNGSVVVANQISVVTNSGANSVESATGSTLTTGNSVSIINNQIVIGGVVDGNSYQVVINKLGQWNGSVWGWQTGNSGISDSDYQTVLASAYSVGSNEGAASSNSLVNWSTSNVKITANSGGNSVSTSSDALIRSGNAIAMANIFNLVGMTFRNSNSFFGLINILDNWQGNLIFAYPDMTVSVDKLDESGNFRIKYKNVGYDAAKGVVIEVNLPDGLKIGGKSKIAWKVGDVGMGEGGFVDVRVDTANENQQIALRKLISKAYAIDNDVEKSFDTEIYLADPDLDSSNNKTVTWVKIRNIEGKNENEGSGDSYNDTTPVVKIEAKNNVNQYVYTDDTVTFEVSLENTNDTASQNNVLYHDIVDDNGNVVFGTAIDLGQIKAKEKSLIRFGLQMPRDFFSKSGQYHSVSMIVGENMVGSQYSSNQATTSFGVRVRGIMGRISKATTGQVEAQVLGVSSGTGNSSPINTKEMWWYLVLMMSSATWLKIGLKKELISMGSGKQWPGFRSMSMLMIMLTIFGFATINVMRNNSGLSSRLDNLTSNFSEVKVLTMKSN